MSNKIELTSENWLQTFIWYFSLFFIAAWVMSFFEAGPCEKAKYETICMFGEAIAEVKNDFALGYSTKIGTSHE